MKRLVPELFLGMLLEHAASDTGQRRRKDEVLDQPRMIFGDRLGDAAADVVAANDRSTQTEFVDEGHDAASLGRSAVSLEWVDTMLVRVSKAPQIGHDDVAVCSKQWHDVAKVRMVARPAMQQYHRPPGGSPTLVGQPKAVARGTHQHFSKLVAPALARHHQHRHRTLADDLCA